jgi:hypothetical protein
MPITRCFLLASSLARLIEKERGGHRVTEGYFPDRPDRATYVRVEEGISSLILVRHASGKPVEEATSCPATRRRLCSIWRKVALHISAFY